MPTTTLTSKGQMTLPKSIRDDLKLHPGDKIDFEKDGDRYVLRPRNKSVTELYGALWRPGQRRMTVRELDEALGEALAEDEARIRAGR